MVTELRVHGVSGSPAESMLDRPLVHRVAGDNDASFSRPRPDYGAATGPGGVQLEAYRWGNLTAGAAARAMWLLLLPFMLANVAIWLRPPAGRRGTLLTRALCRLFALGITAMFVLSLVGVSLDLVAWQCAKPGSSCGARRTYLSFLTSGFFSPTGRRLAVLALVPILAVALLWLLARRTWSRYEAFPVSQAAGGDGLAAAGFWAGKAQVGRLRAIHIATALGTLTAMLLGATAGRDRSWPGYVLAGATAALLAACLVAVCLARMTSRDTPARWAEGAALTLRTTSLVLLGLTIGYAVWPRDDWPTSGGLPGYGMTVTILFAGEIALLVVLALVTTVQCGRHWRQVLLAGLGAPMLGSISLAVAAVFTAGLEYRVADLLDRSGTPSPSGHSVAAAPLQPPASFAWSGLGFAAFVVVVAIVAAVAALWLSPRLRRAAMDVTDADFPSARPRDPGRAAAIDDAIADARLTDHSGPLLAGIYTPLAVGGVVATGLALAGIGPVELAPSGSPAAVALSFATNLGTYLVGIGVLGLLVLGVLAYRYPGIRRVVGVLWDLGTFWPRTAHPLAPPCYAERVVPELVTRASWLAGREGVVLSGHSQGSVLVAAAVLQLPTGVRDRVALVTYGSPLRRLYARLFPAYVNEDALANIREAVGGRWWNLWRDTDPIGGPVGGAPDWRLRDPGAFDIQPGDTVYPPIGGHAGYQQDPVFTGSVTDLASGLPVKQPTAGDADA